MRIRVSKQKMYILLLIIPFFFPSALSMNKNILNIIKLWQICSGGWVILRTVYSKTVSSFLLIFSGIYLSIIVSALLHGSIPTDWIMNLLFLWLINYLTINDKTVKDFFSVYIGWNSIWIIANFITMVVFPNGMYNTSVYSLNWLLGYKNILIRQILPVMVVVLLEHIVFEKNIKIKEKLLLAVCILTIFLSKSVNSMSGLMVFIIVLILLHFKKQKNKKIISLSKMFVIYIISDLVLLLADNIFHFSTWLITTFDKGSSMSGRLGIWSRSLELIKKSFVLGYGHITSEMYNFSFKISHPHNMLLYYLMLGGIICVIFIYLSFKITDNVFDTNKNEKVELIRSVAIAMYTAFLVMGLAESLTATLMLFPMLVLLHNIVSEQNKECVKI